MRKIAIVGAGQAGLQLAIGLLKKDYQVTLVSNKTGDELLKGNIMSSQAMFGTALGNERRLSLNFWEDSCPKNSSISLTVANDKQEKIIAWKGHNTTPFQAIDQRLKFSKWLSEFVRLEGTLRIHNADLNTLEELSSTHDLTLISAGKGEINRLFKIDEGKSAHQKPARTLACHYVKGMIPVKNSPGLRVNILPGIGEYFTMPGLTINGACEMMLFEGVPGGPFDCWNDIATPQQQLEKSACLLKQYLPWEAERCASLSLTDNHSSLKGSYTPTVRHPVAQLPSGNLIYGMGDTVILNDPIAGQGANNASKHADLCLNRIIEHGERPFDSDWMQETFSQVWDDAQWSTRWTNLLLNPLPLHVIELLDTAKHYQALADLLTDSFDRLDDLFPWIESPSDTRSIINYFNSSKAPKTKVSSFKAIFYEIKNHKLNSINMY